MSSLEDSGVESALRDGLAPRLGGPVAGFAVDRRIVRRYSQVMFCRLDVGAAEPLRCVAKVVTGPADNMARQQVLMARDFRVNTHLHATLPRPDLFAVPAPLLFRPDLNLIVTAFEPGVRLQDRLIAAGRGWPSAATLAALEEDCRACGGWVRAFQASTASLIDADPAFAAGLDSIDAGTSVDQVAICLEKLGLAGDSPFSPAQERMLLDFVAERARRIDGADARVAGVHGDCFAGNVLRDGPRTVGIDFVMFRRGIRLVDPAYFVLQLETLRLIPGFRQATVRRLVHAFVQGYDPALDADRFWTGSPAAQVLYVLHRVRRLWGMSGGRVPLHRALMRRLQFVWTARSLLAFTRQQAAGATA